MHWVISKYKPHSISIVAALFLMLIISFPAFAGKECKVVEPTPEQQQAAAATALIVAAALDEVDAPAALVARVGTDLSKQGLVYSHTGFVVRDHPDGRWTVVHLLNECASDDASLYTQGLVNFFADDLVNQDARILWLQSEMVEPLITHLLNLPNNPLFNDNYNLLSRPGSEKTQNSTSWVLETLAVGLPDFSASQGRAQAFSRVVSDGFMADTIKVPYYKRVAGGIFTANVDFTDHPTRTRLSGDYPVITVRAIFRYLQEQGHVAQEKEWRNGQLNTELGPL